MGLLTLTARGLGAAELSDLSELFFIRNERARHMVAVVGFAFEKEESLLRLVRRQ